MEFIEIAEALRQHIAETDESTWLTEAEAVQLLSNAQDTEIDPYLEMLRE